MFGFGISILVKKKKKEADLVDLAAQWLEENIMFYTINPVAGQLVSRLDPEMKALGLGLQSV